MPVAPREMFVKINGERHYLWRAVDREGEVLESFVTKKRDKKAALKFLKTTRKHSRPEILMSDRLRSYSGALKKMGRADKPETSRWLNNQVKISHLPFRRRERAMLRFWLMRYLQPFMSRSTSSSIRNAVSFLSLISY